MIENTVTCYVCQKIIKHQKDIVAIGKGKLNPKPLFRHTKCKPYLAKPEIRKSWKINPNIIIHKDKRKKSRQEKKIQLKKELNND